MSDISIYPCTIIPDRYDGTYSGYKWISFPCNPEDVPKEASGNDVECADFWQKVEDNHIIFGGGDTPDEAYRDLIQKSKR